MKSRPRIRWGLCCVFLGQPIRFRTTTAAHIKRMSRRQALLKLAGIARSNSAALLATLRYCADHNIGCFRINSQILPLRTHAEVGYRVDELPGASEIVDGFRTCGAFAEKHGLRTTFHPDQFVVLSSLHERVVRDSLAEIEYQAEVAEWVRADVINVHGGGAYGDKPAALKRFRRNFARLSLRARRRLTIENDDKIYTPSDLLPLCKASGIPLVYDVHHHRCNPDPLTVEAATQKALATWNREPLFHVSSPQGGWRGPRHQIHADHINVRDFPDCWRGLPVTIEIEARAKERAIVKLQRFLASSS